MKSDLKFFKKSKYLPTDKFFHNVLYDKKIGYYNARQPFGKKGDFITAPNISNLFSEMIAIWIISTWEIFGKPKKSDLLFLQLLKIYAVHNMDQFKKHIFYCSS